MTNLGALLASLGASALLLSHPPSHTQWDPHQSLAQSSSTYAHLSLPVSPPDRIDKGGEWGDIHAPEQRVWTRQRTPPATANALAASSCPHLSATPAYFTPVYATPVDGSLRGADTGVLQLASGTEGGTERDEEGGRRMPLESPALKPRRTDTFPPSLSSDDGAENGEKRQRIRRPKSAAATRCVQKCVATCIRGGAGAPGEGPLNIRRPLVVFKEEFRSRKYCLSECTDICNLLPDGEDGP